MKPIAARAKLEEKDFANQLKEERNLITSRVFNVKTTAGIPMNRSQVYIGLAAFGLSFILVFSTALKNSGMSSFEQLSFRLGFGLLILLIILLSRKEFRFFGWKDAPFFVAIASIYSLFTISGMSSIAFGTPIAVAVALIYTQPIFTAIISHATGKEKITGLKLAAILLGVSGVFFLTRQQIMNLQIDFGIVFPILAGLFYAIYLWLKRQASATQEYTPFQVLFNTFLIAIPFILVVWLTLGNFRVSPLFVGVATPDLWQLLLLIGFASFSTVLPYSLLNFVRPEEVSPTSEGLLLLGDPLLHTLWAILFFEQSVTIAQYMGVALVLLSAAISLKRAL